MNADQGQPLAKPAEPIHDQGLRFDLGTLLGRRGALGAIAGALTGVGLLGRSAVSASTPDTTTAASTADITADTAPANLTEIPPETAGPFPANGSNGPDLLEQAGIVRHDITTSFGEFSGVADGVPVTVEMTLYDMANGNAPLAGAAVYLWQCTRDAGYSLYSAGFENENYLRGVQITDEHGVLSFVTIFPGCYPGRFPHMHFEIYPDEASIVDSTNVIATSQLAMQPDACAAVYATPGYEASIGSYAGITLETDGIFSDDGGVDQLPTTTGDVTKGFEMAIAIGVNTAE